MRPPNALSRLNTTPGVSNQKIALIVRVNEDRSDQRTFNCGEKGPKGLPDPLIRKHSPIIDSHTPMGRVFKASSGNLIGMASASHSPPCYRILSNSGILLLYHYCPLTLNLGL